MLYSYVLYWKMMFLKSNLMFCIEKWGMRISKNSFRKNLHSYVLYWKMRFLKSILLFCIEKWGMRTFFLKLFMYYIEKWCISSQFLCIILKKIYKNSFWGQFLCFILKNEEWGFLKTLSKQKKNEVFEVNSFVLYWKMIISKNSFPKNVIFLCIVLKNDVFEVKSYVLYWKMRNEDF